MEKINCLGEICPVPIVRLQQKLALLKKGVPIMLVTDHSCTRQAVADFCSMHQLEYQADEVINGVWEIIIWNKKKPKATLADGIC